MSANQESVTMKRLTLSVVASIGSLLVMPLVSQAQSGGLLDVTPWGNNFCGAYSTGSLVVRGTPKWEQMVDIDVKVFRGDWCDGFAETWVY